MRKSMVYLNEDLASSIALRYAYRLSQITGMEIDMLHVESSDADGNPPAGSGWVRRTWEDGVIEQERKKIVQLVAMERQWCPGLGEPVIMMGDPETRTLATLKDDEYDLFITGLLHSFSPQLFYKQVQSKLFQQASCPILMVKNLIDIKKIALLISSNTTGTAQINTFMQVFKGANIDVDLLFYAFTSTAKDDVKTTDMGMDKMDKHSRKTLDILKDGGFTPQSVRRMEGTPSHIGERLASYHLVLTSLPGNIGPTSDLLDCLSHVPSTLLFCRE